MQERERDRTHGSDEVLDVMHEVTSRAGIAREDEDRFAEEDELPQEEDLGEGEHVGVE